MKITRNIEVLSRNYTDDFGFKRTNCEILIRHPDGIVIHIPTFPPIKVSRKDNVFDSSVRLTKKDYEEIFERFVLSQMAL